MTQAPGLPAAFLGFIERVAVSTASLVKVGSGWLSDRLRRRKGLIVAGYGLSRRCPGGPPPGAHREAA